jgi:hypothetical protein
LKIHSRVYHRAARTIVDEDSSDDEKFEAEVRMMVERLHGSATGTSYFGFRPSDEGAEEFLLVSATVVERRGHVTPVPT